MRPSFVTRHRQPHADRLRDPRPLASDGWKGSHRIKSVEVSTDSGYPNVVQQWANPLRTYELPYTDLDLPEWIGLADFHVLRGGKARGLLIWDVFRCYAVDQPIGIGDGHTTTFQVATTISDAANSYTRNIGYLVPAGAPLPVNVAAIWREDLTAAIFTVSDAGAARADFTVNPTTGLLSFSGAAPALGHPVLATFFYYTPVRFQNETWDYTTNGFLGSSTPPLIEIPIP